MLMNILKKLTILFTLLFSIQMQGICQSNDTVDIIKSAVRYIGIPYRYGKSDPKVGFDCSGFTQHIFKQMGYILPRTARHQYQEGIHIPREKVQIGDLVFFRGRGNKDGIGHVGIVVNVLEDSFDFIHSRTNGVGIDSSKSKYYQARYVGIKRVLEF